MDTKKKKIPFRIQWKRKPITKIKQSKKIYNRKKI